MQTIWSTFFRAPLPFKERWERVELPDGDFLDLVWDLEGSSDPDTPIVLLLHGLGGNLQSPYVKGLMKALAKRNLRPVLMHFRGCSGVPNRLPRGYHSGETKDLESIILYLNKKYPSAFISAVGFSLGANVLLKWLGETGRDNPLKAAVAVSPPFLLSTVANRLKKGFSRFYQNYLIKKLIVDMKSKFQTVPCPLDPGWDKVKDFWEFDQRITVKLFHFKDVHDYYEKSSCRQFLRHVRVPTLIIHSKDDPFLKPEAAPLQDELSSSISYVLTEKGGHVGFIYGKVPGIANYWLDEQIPEFLNKELLKAPFHLNKK